ncbi:hypothetical protein KR51_00020100 [Rubidibacter lacunae KORDI 51-2]|uniref:Uncharacterized protein n=1 Tax=Rubidibacter lacunae KORDI 51-2 TaxID=582515 RepID=U5DKJ8_9CHRO|nr:hypothetical protein [Rubidibacter lacunae]ERN41437.1 hypothetical protein KR51_00020100 [Rubidibacter lacunae KORDI 51-2]
MRTPMRCLGIGVLSLVVVFVFPSAAIGQVASAAPGSSEATAESSRGISPSQRFFDSGRSNFESEIRVLQESQLRLEDDPLTIDDSVYADHWVPPLETSGFESIPPLELELDVEVVPSEL